MSFENDPPEFTGTKPGISADPIKRGMPEKKPLPVARGKLGIFPERSVPAGTLRPTADGPIAPIDPSAAHTAAVQELSDARAALIQITNAHRAAEEAEGVAVTAWMHLNRPSADSVIREYLAREGAMREANCKAGRDPGYRGEVPEASSQWPIQQAARNRGRHAGGSKQSPGVPLRSNIARRNV